MREGFLCDGSPSISSAWVANLSDFPWFAPGWADLFPRGDVQAGCPVCPALGGIHLVSSHCRFPALWRSGCESCPTSRLDSPRGHGTIHFMPGGDSGGS